MSNQDRLLDDGDLIHQFVAMLNKNGVYKPKIGATWTKDFLNLINTQKRLYAESVIGEDCKGYHDDFDESQMCSYNNILRAEQRARIK